MRRTTGIALALLLNCGAAASGADGDTTVILVRHAEKEGTDCRKATLKQPEGSERAEALVRVIERAGVSVAIHSECLRTKLTLEPAIRKLGLKPEQVLVKTEPQDVADEILQRKRGRTVLVASHSDKLPAIVEELGAPSLCPPFTQAGDTCLIPYDDYYHLFVVTISAQGAATMVWGRYGAPSP